MKRKPMKPFTAWAVYDQSGKYHFIDVRPVVSEAHAVKVYNQANDPRGDWQVCRV